MSTQRYISTSFWDDEWVQTLSLTKKALYLYLMTNTLTNIAGVYKISERRMVFDLGLSDIELKAILDEFEKTGKAYRIKEYVVLPKWPKHQKWETHKKIKAGIENILKELPAEIICFLREIGYSYPLESVCPMIAYDSLSKPIEPYDSLSLVETGEKKEKYPSNYSNIDSNTDINSDIDKDIDPPSGDFSFSGSGYIQPKEYQPDTPHDQPSKSREDVATVFNRTRLLWNELGIPPECRDLIPSNAMISDCMLTFQNYSWLEIENAVKNYHYHTTKADDDWKPPNMYGSLYGFLKNGVVKYFDDEAVKKQFKNQGG